MPRRRVLTIGPAIMASLLAIFVGLNSMVSKYVNVDEEVPQPLARGALAMYMLFGAVIAFVYTPLQSLLPVEALSNSMRAKGLTVYTYTMGCMGFYNIQYRYIAIFAAFDAFESVVWYFCGVESCGKTLEELDEVYEAPYPPAANGGAKLGVAARRMLGLRT
jgi:surface polysaccharide O-acyltransferase-like enzyme